MSTVHALIIVFMILLVGYFLLKIAIYIAELVTRREYSVRAMLINFRQKIWMTTGLGLFFCVLFLGVVFAVSQINDPSLRLRFFLLVHKHPVEFIYLGLCVFICFSVGVCVARKLIIYLYHNTRR